MSDEFEHPGAAPIFADHTAVSNPQHYSTPGIDGLECIDVIEALGLPYHLGNVLKYIFRAGRKEGQPKERDLLKARWYLDRYITTRFGSGDK